MTIDRNNRKHQHSPTPPTIAFANRALLYQQNPRSTNGSMTLINFCVSVCALSGRTAIFFKFLNGVSWTIPKLHHRSAHSPHRWHQYIISGPRSMKSWLKKSLQGAWGRQLSGPPETRSTRYQGTFSQIKNRVNFVSYGMRHLRAQTAPRAWYLSESTSHSQSDRPFIRFSSNRGTLNLPQLNL